MLIEGHEGCNYAYLYVGCDYCGRQYVVTPQDDLYCVDMSITNGNVKHACEPCLLQIIGTTDVIVIDVGKATLETLDDGAIVRLLDDLFEGDGNGDNGETDQGASP